MADLIFTRISGLASSVFGDYNNPTSGNGASISITMRSAAFLCAPAGVWLEATSPSGFDVSPPSGSDVYDPTYHDIDYFWVVRDQPLSAFAAPTNLVTGWNNPNVMHGRKVAFHFPDAGTYIVDLWCIDRSGNTATASQTVTVQSDSAADTRYTGTNTICFSTSGTFTDAPSGAKQVTVSTQADITDEFGANFANPTRVLFRSGEEFDVFFRLRDNLEYVGAFGTGAKPIFNARSDANQIYLTSETDQLTIVGIEHRDGWDSTTETGSYSAFGPFFLGSAQATALTISDCDFSGFTTVRLDQTAAGSVTILADSTVTNWHSYGVVSFSSVTGSYMAIIGARIAQDVDALNGGAKDGVHNEHGPIRISRVTDFFGSQTDLFSRTGWSALSPDIADQPCVRFNTNPGGDTNKATWERCTMEGGANPFVLGTTNSGDTKYPGNYLLDTILFVGTSKTAFDLVNIQYGGTTVRNCVGIMPNVPEYHDNWQAALFAGFSPSSTANASEPVKIYSNTFVNLQSDANNKAESWTIATSDFTAVTNQNNVLHAPDIGTGAVSSDDPLDEVTAIPGFSPRYKGVGYNTDLDGAGTIDATYSSVGKTIPLARPQTGSAAIDDGDTGLVPYADFLGVVRPATGNERGAVQETA